jgi:hypothetical protein
MTQSLKASVAVYDTGIAQSGKTGVNFVNPEKEAQLKAKGNKGTAKSSTPYKGSIFLQDIAQSHHFTVYLDGFSSSKFKTPEGTFSPFLPVKSMNFNYLSYENMSIPVAIFGDFPLLNKKRLTTISLTCFDMDSNLLEKELKLWENQCFPKGRYVAYMQDIVRKLIYRGYNVKGKETLKYELFVIPTGNVSVSRDYSTNDAKLVTFNLICVGNGSTCATGEGIEYRVGDGDGNARSAYIDISGKVLEPKYEYIK